MYMKIFSSCKYMMNDPHHVYLDLDVINNNEDNKVVPTLRFEEIRNTPFLDGDSSEYFCSIVRFSIQTGNSLPVFIPKIKLGQPDPNLTIYTVKLAWSTYPEGYDYSGTRMLYTGLKTCGLNLPNRRWTNKTYQAHTIMCIIMVILLIW